MYFNIFLQVLGYTNNLKGKLITNTAISAETKKQLRRMNLL